jgi:ATP-dependent RNA helicase DDX60
MMLSAKLGFDINFSTAPFASSPNSEQADQPFLSEGMVKKLLEDLKRVKSPVLPNSTKFQLENCGPYVEKGFDSQPDPRVSNFNPDAWQRDVLDTIDKRDSLVVVAPTSAGKTFISFYAMKQVLKESDDGVLVYVAPTKALCNQVAADVQARFKKSYPQMMGAKSVWAINTRDYRINNTDNCQVLVTVPQMLQNLLLSPSSSSGSGKTSWTSRIKWIIFDEVHSIGQSEEGVVWEQLLLMAPCPIIALSATVGNPYELKHWLEGCEKDKGRQLRMTIHSTRYSDLRCYYWTPPADFKFSGFSPSARWPIPGIGTDGYNQESPFEIIHPVATLMDR